MKKKKIFPITINNKLINIEAENLYQALQQAKLIKQKEDKK